MQFGQHLQNMIIHKGNSRMQLCTTHICHCWEILDGDKAERVQHRTIARTDDMMIAVIRYKDIRAEMTNTDDNNMPGNMSVGLMYQTLDQDDHDRDDRSGQTLDEAE